ncbi:GNAT family N-acetyltransferase [Candidatus Babeliales bacterium]|nr:GNAT family N-acetyltransferase [Candidatus Babeliales bacterium]
MMDIFNLSNDLIVRKNSFNQENIELQDHIRWFTNKINSDDCIFYVAKSKKNDFIGYVRFDKENEKEYVITIHLSKEFRGRGLGYKIIKDTSNLFFEDCVADIIHAYIKKDNHASLKSFLKCRYEIIGEKIINNQICLRLKCCKFL